MAHYKRITKRKEKKKELLLDPTSQIQDWFSENAGKLLMAAGGVFLAGAVAYGVVYYKKVSLADAQERLYKITQAASETFSADTDRSIAALGELIENGGPALVISQARLKLAALYMGKKEYDKAAEQYRLAVNEAGSGSLYQELSMAGEGSALAMAGRESEAERKFAKLADSARFYPRAEALLSMAYVSASKGKTREAIETLNLLKAERASFLTAEQIDGIIRRVERGDLVKALDNLKDAPSEPADGQPAGGGRIGKKSVHQAK